MGIDTSMGFVAFPRGLTTWEWYDDPNTCRLFFHLMLTANWEPKNWHGIVIAASGYSASPADRAEDVRRSYYLQYVLLLHQAEQRGLASDYTSASLRDARSSLTPLPTGNKTESEETS